MKIIEGGFLLVTFISLLFTATANTTCNQPSYPHSTDRTNSSGRPPFLMISFALHQLTHWLLQPRSDFHHISFLFDTIQRFITKIDLPIHTLAYPSLQTSFKVLNNIYSYTTICYFSCPFLCYHQIIDSEIYLHRNRR